MVTYSVQKSFHLPEMYAALERSYNWYLDTSFVGVDVVGQMKSYTGLQIAIHAFNIFCNIYFNVNQNLCFDHSVESSGQDDSNE